MPREIRRPRLRLFTDFAAYGGTPIRGIPDEVVLDGRHFRSATLEDEAALVLAADSDVAAEITRGHVLRIDDDALAKRTFEYRVSEVDRGDGLDSGDVIVQATGVFVELTNAGLVVDVFGGTFSTAIGPLTLLPSEIIRDYVIESLSHFGLTQWSLGTVEDGLGPVTIDVTNATPAKVLRSLESAVNDGLVTIERLGDGGWEIGFTTQPTLGKTTVRISVPRGNARSIRETVRNAEGYATHVQPVTPAADGGSVAVPLRGVAFQHTGDVQATTGAHDVKLDDPDNRVDDPFLYAAGDPVREDGDHVGRYAITPSRRTPREILSSNALDADFIGPPPDYGNSIEIADPTGFTSDVLLLVADTGALSTAETNVKSILEGDGKTVTVRDGDLAASYAGIDDDFKCCVVGDTPSVTTVRDELLLARPIPTLMIHEDHAAQLVGAAGLSTTGTDVFIPSGADGPIEFDAGISDGVATTLLTASRAVTTFPGVYSMEYTERGYVDGDTAEWPDRAVVEIPRSMAPRINTDRVNVGYRVFNGFFEHADVLNATGESYLEETVNWLMEIALHDVTNGYEAVEIVDNAAGEPLLDVGTGSPRIVAVKDVDRVSWRNLIPNANAAVFSSTTERADGAVSTISAEWNVGDRQVSLTDLPPNYELRRGDWIRTESTNGVRIIAEAVTADGSGNATVKHEGNLFSGTLSVGHKCWVGRRIGRLPSGWGATTGSQGAPIFTRKVGAEYEGTVTGVVDSAQDLDVLPRVTISGLPAGTEVQPGDIFEEDGGSFKAYILNHDAGSTVTLELYTPGTFEPSLSASDPVTIHRPALSDFTEAGEVAVLMGSDQSQPEWLKSPAGYVGSFGATRQVVAEVVYWSGGATTPAAGNGVNVVVAAQDGTSAVTINSAGGSVPALTPTKETFIGTFTEADQFIGVRFEPSVQGDTVLWAFVTHLSVDDVDGTVVPERGKFGYSAASAVWHEARDLLDAAQNEKARTISVLVRDFARHTRFLPGDEALEPNVPVRVVSDVLGLDLTFTLKEAEYSLFDPESTTITLINAKRRLSKVLAGSAS